MTAGGVGSSSGRDIARLSIVDATWLIRHDVGQLARMHARVFEAHVGSRALARRVNLVLRGLGPIVEPRLLAESLIREAGLAAALRSDLSPLRIGYAIRYVELTDPEAEDASSGVAPPSAVEQGADWGVLMIGR